MTQPASAGVIRFCPVCQVADDHPRHMVIGTDPRVAPHMKCCADAGCPDGSCNVQVWLAAVADDPKGPAGKSGDVPQGDNLRAFLTDPKARETLDQCLEERDAATRHFTLQDLDTNVHGSIVQEFITLQPSNGGNA